MYAYIRITDKLIIFESKKARSSIVDLNLTEVSAESIDFKLNL
jgi:hypothetical protein